MTSNKLPPLPERLTAAQIEAGWKATFSTTNPFCPCDLKTFTKAARWAEAEALRQSQSLPAGAVAGLLKSWRASADDCVRMAERLGDASPSLELHRDAAQYRMCADQIEAAIALQAEAREKGESPSLNQIPKPCAYPPVDSETGADTGSCCHHAYADGWNECRAEAIRLATQPAQASEKYVSLCSAHQVPVVGCRLCDTTLVSTHPQPVTPAGGEVCPSLWVADALVDSCRLLGDAATVHRVMVATKPQAQYTMPLYLHPPVADAAPLRDALVQARDWFESQAKAISKGCGSTWDLLQVREQRDLADAALNQRGGGDHG